MTSTRLHHAVAGLVFTASLLLYLFTVTPTAAFWDCGEFIAISNGLQVSHPPGAPFYMLVGRLFSMFAGSPERIAYMVNLVSVLSSAGTILLTHLSIVRLVQHWQPPAAERSWTDHLAALAGGVVGAMAFAASDSFWFNATEAEVYAPSMFFTALVVWLILKWSEDAAVEEMALPGTERHPFGLSANRYLVIIAYMFGLALGVHLLNLLAMFFCALIFYFSEVERDEWTTRQRWTGLIGVLAVSGFVFLLIYPGIVQWLPTMMRAMGSIAIPTLLISAVLVWFIWWTHQRGRLALNLLGLALATVLIGYSTYAVIFIRSAANPPIDENDPETVEAVVSYLKREQYGESGFKLSGQGYDNATGAFVQKSMPRRHSQDPSHIREYQRYDSDLGFFFGYQVNYMYWRYFLWQFVGKDSDVQGAPAITGFGFVDDAIEGKMEVRQTPSERKSRNVYYALPLLLGLFGMAYHLWRDWRRASAVGLLFFLTGLGIILYLNQTPYQPRERDYSYVASFFAFALWIGIGATGLVELAAHALGRGGRMPVAADPEPLGDDTDETPSRRTVVARPVGSTGLVAGAVVAVIAFLAVPGLMLAQNYDDHDRSKQYVAPDYAYNMLQSVDENAVLFTNGDNDTFPLWYAQEVEHVRRDVRVTVLSLLQTPWMMKQLKNQSSRTSAPVPMDLTDAQIDEVGAVGGIQWTPRTETLPVPDPMGAPTSEVARASGPGGLRPEFTMSGVPGVLARDAGLVERPMQWRIEGRQYGPDFTILGSNDLAIVSMIRTNAQNDWKRPFYFAVTVAPDGQVGLGDHLQLEGQAQRVVPIRTNEALGRVAGDIALERMRRFRFRGLADTTAYFDENIRRMVDNYRNVYSRVAEGLAAQGRNADAVALLDTLMERVPFSTIGGDARSYAFMAQAYGRAGAADRVARVFAQAQPYLQGLYASSDPNDRLLGVNFALYAARIALQSGAPEQAKALVADAEPVLSAASTTMPPQELFQSAQSLILTYGATGDLAGAKALADRLARTTGISALTTSADTLALLVRQARVDLGLDSSRAIARPARPTATDETATDSLPR